MLCLQYFKYEFKNRDDCIAPGLCAMAVVKYAVVAEDMKSDELIVTVDGCPIPIPVRVYVILS